MFNRTAFIQFLRANRLASRKSGNTHRMKTKYITKKRLFIAILIAMVALLVLCSCDSGEVSQQEIAQSCIRIHIRANSNGDSDQTVKLAVRDNITAYLETALMDCSDKKQAAAVLEREKGNLIRIADATLAENGFKYKSSIRLDNEYFPARYYDGYEFPEGNYDAVVINLGSGTGDNWWCVAFPPLCFVPDTQDGEKIVYKSWIKEMLDKIFG